MSTYSGIAETFSEKSKDDILMRMFDFKEVFRAGIEMMEKFGMDDAIKNARQLSEEDVQANLERQRDAERAEKAKYRFRYKGGW